MEPRVRHATLSEAAYERLRDAIASGTLEPGQRITERAAAALCGVSQTPAREALGRLEREGLLDRRGPRTVVVASVPESKIAQMGHVEVRLRGLVARFAALNATSGDLEKISESLEHADDLIVAIQAGGRDERRIARLVESVRSFNALVESACHLPTLLDILDQTRTLSPIQRDQWTVQQLMADPQFASERYVDHRRLLESLVNRDPDAAQAIAERHADMALSEFLSIAGSQ